MVIFFFFKQKTAYEMRISDWSSDVCSSDLQFGHSHDHAEATTLFDPATRALLKSALDAMWQSEGLLRQGQPAAALPHAYQALRFIKQVQQASRIYLDRKSTRLNSSH